MSQSIPELVVMISGNGSNLQAIINQIQAGKLQAHIRCVISNKADAYGLQRAQAADIACQISDDHQQILTLLNDYQPDLIVLAGYMRILPAEIIQAFPNRIINIHPSLLPKYRGLNTYQRVLAANEKQHGTTVHIVTEDLDDGPILAQEAIRIDADDNEQSLKQKIQVIEHRLYPQVIAKLLTR